MEENYLKQIGYRLLCCRSKRDLSRKDFARIAGVSTAVVIQMETGDSDVGIENASRICKALNCSADYLFNGEVGTAEWVELNRRVARLPEQDDANMKRIFRMLWEAAPKEVR